MDFISPHDQNDLMDNSLSLQDMLAALQFQVDWGVCDVIEDHASDSFAPVAKILQKKSEKQNIERKNENSAENSQNIPHGSEEDCLRSAKDFEALVARSQELPGFMLPRLASHAVCPQIIKGAQLLIIGELPTDEEDKTGKVFSGVEGALLEQVLSSLEIKKEMISLSSALPWRVPGGQGQPLSNHIFQRAVIILHRIIEMAEPKYILTLGQNPLNLVLGKKVPLVKTRGQIHEITIRNGTTPCVLLPTYSLAQVQNTATIRRYFWHDMLLLAENIGF